MKRTMLALSVLALAAASAGAADDPKVSVGYSFVKYLEDGGGSAPLGVYLSLWSGSGTALELDLGYQRDKEEDITLNTFTALAGPRFSGDSSTKPYFHVLGGIRHDRVLGESNTAFGGMAGAGVDVSAGGSILLRLGADFQIFFDEGENIKTLRLSAGFTF